VANPLYSTQIPPKWQGMGLMGRDVQLNLCIMEEAVTYNEHGTDVSSAELGIRGILHVNHPAGHQNPKPRHQQVLDLYCR